MYVKIVAKNATLYQKPYEWSKKKVAYYKYGDVIAIEYCNQDGWCKIKHGYIKRDVLSVSSGFAKKIHLIPYKKKLIVKDLYDEYFYKYKSVKLIIEDTKSL